MKQKKEILEFVNKKKEEIIKKNKDVLLIIFHGSGARNELKQYSDIDLEVFVKGKAPENILSFEEVNGIKRFVGIKFFNLEEALKEIKSPENWIWNDYLQGAKILYDKKNYSSKLISKIKKPRESDFLQSIPEEFWYKIEELCKIKNAYLSGDKLSVIGQSRYLAYGCFKIISVFNEKKKLPKPKDEFERFFILNKKPTHFEKDFKICTEFGTNKKSIKKIYHSSMRLMLETIYFLREQKKISKINNKWFNEILFNKEIINMIKK
jgi:predicted nucleotidyltransferase